ILTYVLYLMNRDVYDTVNGQRTQVPGREALTRQYFNNALQGSAHSLHQFTDLANTAETLWGQQVEQDRAIGENLRAHQTAKLEQLIASARAQGLSEAETLEKARCFTPHPEDIIIDDDGYRIKGPWNEEGLKPILDLRALRDAFLLQHELDERSPLPDGVRWEQTQYTVEQLTGCFCSKDVCEGRSSLFIAQTLDDWLPHRFQLSDIDTLMRMNAHQTIPKRELLKQCYNAWKDAGLPRPRGWLSPPFLTGVEAMTAFAQLIKIGAKHAKSGKMPTALELAEELRDLLA
ncbi:MAG: hypothetical protein AAFQ15_04755, partial [Pseudomonadota bacterium]